MLQFPREGVNLRKSSVFCENLRFGLSLSPQFCHLKLALTICMLVLKGILEGPKKTQNSIQNNFKAKTGLQ